MQDRYVGDIGDYVKLALLRALSPGRKLGVAWYLTPDESHNADGRHTGYLQSPDRWRHLDPSLYDMLHDIVAHGRRNVDALEAGPLSGALAFRDRLIRPAHRTEWFEALKGRVSDCDLVFLDPDNGLEPAGFRAGSGKSIKSATYAEVAALMRPGRALVIYHHQTRMAGGHDFEIEHLAGRLLGLGAERVLAVRSKPFSPRVFFIVDADYTLADRARQFAARWHGLVTLREFAAPNAQAECSAGMASKKRSDIALILKAASFAAEKHRSQRRKDADASPYINHPLALAHLLATDAGIDDPVVLCAALLHDTIEDTETSYDELVAEFGREIADVVVEVTDDKSLPKAERKRLQVAKASSKSAAAKLVKLADKTCNLRDIAGSPPADWPIERKQQYFDWAREVVVGLRGASPALERAFDQAAACRPVGSSPEAEVSEASA